jgi:ribosomal protein S18 acetylase RimI-like enzyme
VAAAVGPVGRNVERSIDVSMRAEILSYSRSRGLFAGASLGGSTLRADNKANGKLCDQQLDDAIDLGDVPEEVAKRLPKYPAISATLLGRLAVSTAFRGRGLGVKSLMDALHRSLKLSEQAASTGVVVGAKDEEACAFYRKYGFIEFPKIDKRLFLPMGTIEKLFAEQQVAKAL